MDGPDGAAVMHPLVYGSLAVACGAAQVLISLALRPETRRIAALKDRGDRPSSGHRPALSFEAIGRVVLGLRGRRRGGERGADALVARSAGAAAVFGACLLPFGISFAVLGGLLGWGFPRLVDARAAKARTAAFADDLPEVVDLLGLALGAGLNVPLAVDAVGRRGVGPLSVQMAAAAEATRRGQRLADALDELAARCGEGVRPLMSLLAAGERYGVPLGESLERLAVDVRAARRRRAEERARRLPVKMLFPLVVCILPAFALLTLGPLLLTSFRDLGW